MRPDMFGVRLNRRARLRNAINDAMPVIDKAVEHYNLNEHYDRRSVSSPRAVGQAGLRLVAGEREDA